MGRRGVRVRRGGGQRSYLTKAGAASTASVAEFLKYKNSKFCVRSNRVTYKRDVQGSLGIPRRIRYHWPTGGAIVPCMAPPRSANLVLSHLPAKWFRPQTHPKNVVRGEVQNSRATCAQRVSCAPAKPPAPHPNHRMYGAMPLCDTSLSNGTVTMPPAKISPLLIIQALQPRLKTRPAVNNR